MMNTTPMTVEDLFRKYVPERGTPLSADVIYWANRFGNVIEPNEEEQFRNEMLAKYGVLASDGGNASMSAAPGPGQGISSTAQNIGFGLMGYGQLGFAPGSMVASMVGNAIADQQVDAIADSFGAMSAAAPNASIGIGTVSDPEGNISTVSTPGMVAAADEATFGTADAAAPGSDVSGAADEGSHGADGNNPGVDDTTDDSDAAAAADDSDADAGDSSDAGDGDFRYGGAVRRFDIGGNEGRAELRATPQSPFLGKVASALKSLQEMAGQYQVLPQVPLLGGTGVDELFGLPGAAREVENWSYGNAPMRINPYAGRTASYIPEVKPGRKSDLADTAFLGLDVVPVAGLANKGVSRLANTASDAAVRAITRNPQATAQGVLQEAAQMAPLSHVIKNKGGNWLPGDIEEITRPLRLRATGAPNIGREPAAVLADLDALVAQNVEAGVPVDTRFVEDVRANLAPKAAINKWIDTKLNKYIRNEMATPDDPVRALAERGVLHYEAPGVRDYSPMMDIARSRRKAAGFPLEDTATTDLGKMWERYADSSISNDPAQQRIKDMSLRGYDSPLLEENPWIKNLPPDTPVYRPDYIMSGAPQRLGFDHLIDELRAAIDPTSDLPAHLKLDVNKLDKVTMPQAVELVDKINKWRSAEAAKAEKLGMLGNLKNTPRLESPDLNLSFTEKPGGLWVDLPEAIGDDGKQVCTTVGKQGGWCTQHASTAEHYGAGDNRLVALLDADGRPHVQVQIANKRVDAEATQMGDLLEPEDAIGDQFFRNVAEILEQRGFDEDAVSDTIDHLATGGPRARVPQDVLDVLGEVELEAERMLPVKELPAPDIIQLKPPANDFNSERAREYARRDPQYRNKITDSVLQFLNSGNWGKVNDLDQYNIVDLADPHVMLREVEDGWGANGKDIFNAMISADPNAPRFMRRGEFVQRMDEFLPEGPPSSRIGYAGGGIVKLLSKYIGKKAAEEAAQDLPKEQKMLQGFYRGYAGDYDAAKAAAQDSGVFVSPQRAVAEYYAAKRAGQTGLDPHLEMILADPFSGRGYGHSTRGTGKNPPMVTRARELAPEDVKDRTQLKAAGGLVNFDRDEIAQIAERAMSGYAAGGLVDYDPDEIGTIVSRVKEEFHA